MIKKCWICEVDDAVTDEHFIMRSAIEKVLGKISDGENVFFHYDEGKKNIPVRSYKNTRLTFNKILCRKCNEALSQPYDNEFLSFIERLKSSKNLIISRNRYSLVNFNRVNLALYFIKIFGCLLEDSDSFISQKDRYLFSQSILKGKVLTNNVYVSLHRDICLIAKKDTKMISSHPVFGDGFRTWLIDFDWITLLVSYPFPPIQKEYGEQWNLYETPSSIRVGKRK